MPGRSREFFLSHWLRKAEMIPIGTRVGWSASALQSDRDYWQSQGEPIRKQQAKRHYDEKAALRGEVIEHKKNSQGYAFAVVRWDDGGIVETSFSRLKEC